MARAIQCYPQCRWFKCAKKAMIRRRNDIWCRWTEENCEISNCSYAICAKRRLLPKGICGESVKRKTIETEPEEVVSAVVKLRGKALRKIGEKEIF